MALPQCSSPCFLSFQHCKRHKKKDELGWYPETPFEAGIKTTIKWYLDNKNWMNNLLMEPT